MSIFIISTSCLTSLGKGLFGLLHNPGLSTSGRVLAPDALHLQEMAERELNSFTLQLQTLSNLLCLYLFVVWACKRDSNFCTNSNCYSSSTQHRRPPFISGVHWTTLACSCSHKHTKRTGKEALSMPDHSVNIPKLWQQFDRVSR